MQLNTRVVVNALLRCSRRGATRIFCPVDNAPHRRGLRQEIAFAVSYCRIALVLIATSELIVTAAARLARAYASRLIVSPPRLLAYCIDQSGRERPHRPRVAVLLVCQSAARAVEGLALP